jgi:protease I
MSDLQDKRVAILVDDNFEDAEFTGPLKALQDAGADVDVVATEAGKLHGLNHIEPANTYQSDKLIDDIKIDEYDALVLPGGAINADSLRMNEKARIWIKKFMDKGKPVGAICHAPWALASAGVAGNRKMTSYFSIQDDMRNAGAEWVDEEVVVDDNLITSRQPDDVPAFDRALIAAIKAA